MRKLKGVKACWATTLVLLSCVRFSLSSRLFVLCCLQPTLPLDQWHALLTYHLASFTMQLIDAYLLPLLASSFTFLFQASICACLLSSTESRWPLYKKKKKERESLGQTGQLYYLTFLSFKPCFICSLPSWSLNCRLYVTVLNYSNKANSLFWWK